MSAMIPILLCLEGVMIRYSSAHYGVVVWFCGTEGFSLDLPIENSLL
jgi:hypothetical protein